MAKQVSVSIKPSDLMTVEEKMRGDVEVRWRLELLPPKDRRLLNWLHDKEIRELKRLEKFQERNR